MGAAEGNLVDSASVDGDASSEIQVPAATAQANIEPAGIPTVSEAIVPAPARKAADYAALADSILAGRSWHSGYRAASVPEAPAVAEPVFIEPAAVEPEPVAEPAPEPLPEVAGITSPEEATVLHGEILAASPDDDAFLADVAWLADITHRPEPIWGVGPSKVPAAESESDEKSQTDRKRTMAA